MKKTLGTFFAVTLTAFAGSTCAQSVVDIPQVPANATPTGNEEAAIKATDNDKGDYQDQIMNDPATNDRARAEAVINAGNNLGTSSDGIADNADAVKGNTAVIIQKGKANTSSITQQGDNNSATQTQTGTHNDLRVEQAGKNNRSVESQTGSYNHKVKIQNGHVSDEETTDMEEGSPSAEGKQ